VLAWSAMAALTLTPPVESATVAAVPAEVVLVLVATHPIPHLLRVMVPATASAVAAPTAIAAVIFCLRHQWSADPTTTDTSRVRVRVRILSTPRMEAATICRPHRLAWRTAPLLAWGPKKLCADIRYSDSQTEFFLFLRVFFVFALFQPVFLNGNFHSLHFF
jgi:hypothetical protein